jgi:prophage regulatory protein
MKFIRRNQVQKITGLSRSSIYAMVADGTFPKQIKIGRRAVAWLETEIDVWMLSRVNSG